MLNNIPVDREVLRKWLESGYMEDGQLYPSNRGTPQGGIMTPRTQKVTFSLSVW